MFIAAIDQGTTSTRCILFDKSGIVAMAQREHEQIFPRPGWVEHDPIEIWHRTEEVISQTLRIAQCKPGEIAAIGIANQRETTIVWDPQTGQPLCNAIVWQDTRTKNICDELARRRAGSVSTSERASAGDLFFGAENQMDSRQYFRRSRGGTKRAGDFRNG